MNSSLRSVLRIGASGLIAALTFAGWSTGPTRAATEVAREVPAESEGLAPGDTVVLSPRQPWNEPRAVAETPSAPSDDDRISVLVHFDAREDKIQRPGLKSLVLGLGGYVKYEYEVLPNVINVRDIRRKDVDALRAMPGVAKVEEDYEVTIQHNDSMPLIRALQSQITAAGFTATGAGTRVCVIDTGIDSNSIMYSGRIDAAAGWDFVNNDSNPEDDNGHGSHVSGTVLGGFVTADFGCAGPESMQGVAPAATLIGVKVLNASGSGTASNIIAGINRCASTTLPGGQADVINMSLGGGQFSATCDTDTIAAAANNAVTAGVVVVAAAGNNNFTNAVSSPACGSKVIAVAAIYDDNYPSCEFPTQTTFQFCTNNLCTTTCTDTNPTVNQRCCFSNRSAMVDVAAPGCIIFSDDSTVAGGNGLVGFCGTSQAAPHVAGLAALLLSAAPSLTPAQVESAIQSGAVDLGAAGFDNNFGWGRIDAINSLNIVAPPAGCTTNGQCDDGVFCNGAETCVAGSCQAGSNPCTSPLLCRESDDQCVQCLSNANCDDGLFCNGSETCGGSGSCQAGTDPCPGLTCDETNNVCVGGAEVWMSFLAATAVPSVGTVENEDIVARNVNSGAWSLIFDGSDVGIAALTIDGMERMSDGSILLSFADAGSVPGLTGGPSGTSVDDSDIVRFVPTSLGATTAGSFSFYFDGSDVGLTTNNEDIDAIALTASDQLVISTVGNATATGASGSDTDLLVFTATSLGSVTAGSFAVHFDGSDVGLTDGGAEDVDAASRVPDGKFLFSTTGNFAVTGVSGANEDVFQFTPTTLGATTSGTFAAYLDLSALGIATTADVGSVSYKP